MSGLCLEFATLRYDMHSLALLLSFSLLNQTSLSLSFFLHRCPLLSFSLARSLSLSLAICLSLSLCFMPLPHTPPLSLSGHLCVHLQANPGLHLSLPPRCTYVCVCVCVCVYVCACVCICICMCECVCVCIHTHTHTHIYICRYIA